ncbi:DUF6461 domain-containing protein [Streptomyces buecherae]|uniref:Uncharacterized protein n=1 Tax=Streptomyces buecherae TaxID=2763006 RepID=A0A7H8NAD4_9ACTN|nr:hypothetical protein [Streptomyces buecherae]QKW51490.1 hypothetical protein HUT08_20325 [Streptomyces buecherae]
MNTDGIRWLVDKAPTWYGYCIHLARGLEAVHLVNRITRGPAPVLIGEYTAEGIETYINSQEREMAAVRYGTHGDLAFTVAHGYWPGELGPGYSNHLSRNSGEEVFELYYETQNPKVPPPQFTFYRDGEYACGFDMYMYTWSHEVTGPDADLIHADIEAAGIHNEDRRETAHLKSLTIIEKRFTLTLPMNQILHGSLPAALVHGHHVNLNSSTGSGG